MTDDSTHFQLINGNPHITNQRHKQYQTCIHWLKTLEGESCAIQNSYIFAMVTFAQKKIRTESTAIVLESLIAMLQDFHSELQIPTSVTQAQFLRFIIFLAAKKNNALKILDEDDDI